MILLSSSRWPTLTKIITTLWSALVCVWVALRPTLFAGSKEDKKLSRTAWLNGLRGWAAMFVVFSHCTIPFGASFGKGWNSKDPKFLELPIIRLFYDGGTMVTLFFIISGYALSCKPLSLIGRSDHSPIFNSLASSTFRRCIRLFTPTATIAFAAIWVRYFNLWYPYEVNPPGELNTVWSSLCWWFNAVLYSINPFSETLPNPWHTRLMKIESALWTIPVEYRGSLAVFGLLLVLSKTQVSVCTGSLVLFLFWLTWIGQWDIWLFIAGMLCCQFRLLTRKEKSPRLDDETSMTQKSQNLWRTVLFDTVGPLLALVPILYVLSQPGGWMQPPDWDGWGDAPFYPILNYLTPASWNGHNEPGRFWRCIAAVALTTLVDHTCILQSLFTAPFSQYLGEISFSMYLVHPLIIHTLSTRVYVHILTWTDSMPHNGFRDALCVGITMTIFLPILYWISDLSTRYLDQGSVDLARWLEGKFYGIRKPTRHSANVNQEVLPVAEHENITQS